MAKEAGIEGFCYWHYWFGNGKQLLEKPFQEVLATGKPDFPFCLGWANESWYKKTWEKNGTNKLLIEQKYGGSEDYRRHFFAVLPALRDQRYMNVDGKPIFLIYRPYDSEEVKNFMREWQELARENGLNSFFFIGHDIDNKYPAERYKSDGFSAVTYIRMGWLRNRRTSSRFLSILVQRLLRIPYIASYKKAARYFLQSIDSDEFVCPSIITGWDHTPRSGAKGLVLTGYNPKEFSTHVKSVIDVAKEKENSIVFVKSWNEWAEGNYLEPDQKFGRAYLDELRKILDAGEK